ncbi:MAG TPA: hypothetical protein VH020_09305 [Stellaceae bacterium]|nr:hypothetical protein [Stellaceae bacterium]
MRKTVWLKPISEDAARRGAYILGRESAFAKALAELERRRTSGEDDVALFLSRDNFIVVGPRQP